MAHRDREIFSYRMKLLLLVLVAGLTACEDPIPEQLSPPASGEEAVEPKVEKPEAEATGVPSKPKPEAHKSKTTKKSGYTTYSQSSRAPDISYGKARAKTATVEKPKVPKDKLLDVYKVELGVDTNLQHPGPPGELVVWIGDPGQKAKFDDGMATDEELVPAVGQTAAVKPYAPDFDVDPRDDQCIRIHPMGSEVRFALTPRDTGVFEVGADVRLYKTDDCSGTHVPRSVASLEVTVEVNSGKAIEGTLLEMLKIARDKFLEFWEAFVILLFGLTMFLIRDKLKRWFGYEVKG